MLKLSKWYQDWRESRELKKMQRVISKKYDQEVIPFPDNLDLSEETIYSAAYINYKAFSFLTIGPELYRKQDYFNLPPEDWDASRIEIIKKGCEQIRQWRGLTRETALIDLGIEGFYDLLEMFHFRLFEQRLLSVDTPDYNMDKMIMEHIVTKKQIILFNKVKEDKTVLMNVIKKSLNKN